MDDKKIVETVLVGEGDKPSMEIIHEGPTQPEERVQFNDKLEELEDEAEADEREPESYSGFFAPKSRKYMRAAIREAKLAVTEDEVPVGCVIVWNDKIIARAHNKCETDHDPTAHAEILALREAGKKLKNWRLSDCEIYITLEPCQMCLGAIVQSGIKKVVFGASESVQLPLEKRPIFERSKIVEVISGVEEEACTKILQDFFKKKRQKQK